MENIGLMEDILSIEAYARRKKTAGIVREHSQVHRTGF